MAYSYTEKKRIRKDFGKLPQVMDIPSLLAIQLESYQNFTQEHSGSGVREMLACRQHSNQCFPLLAIPVMLRLIMLITRSASPCLTLMSQLRGVTYAAPLRVKVRLIIYDRESNNKAIKDIKEQEVYNGRNTAHDPVRYIYY